MFRILVAEDDDPIRKLIAKYLEQNGFEIIQATDGQKALELFDSMHIDMVITDLMMPYVDGFELTKKIRTMNLDIPILMLTALEAFHDKEKGFLSGTDDYLVKPFEMKELLLRVKALFRRYRIASENKIEYKSLLLDFNSFSAQINKEFIELTKKEFLLLYKLVASPNIIFTRNQLMDEIWGFDNESFDRTVDTHITRIRKKIICDDLDIVTVRGLGYKVVLK